MIIRESIIESIMSRLWAIKPANGYANTVALVRRNPTQEIDTYPAICVYEGQDTVKDRLPTGKRSAGVSVARVWAVELDIWMQGTTDAMASKELMSLLGDVRKCLLVSGNGTLDGMVKEIQETGVSEVYRPDEHSAGIMIALSVIYADTY